MSIFDESADANRSITDLTTTLDSHGGKEDNAPSASSRTAHYHASLRFLADSLSSAGLIPTNIAGGNGFIANLECAYTQGKMDERACEELVEGLMMMWRDRQKWQTQAQQCTSELDRLRSDLNHSQQRVADLKEEKADAERKAWEIEMKRRQLEKESSQREKSLRSEVLALDKKCTMISRRDNQYRHELRKSEQQLQKIQEKLHKIILEKTSATHTIGGTSMGSTQLSRHHHRRDSNSNHSTQVSSVVGGMELSSTLRPMTTSSLRNGRSGAFSANHSRTNSMSKNVTSSNNGTDSPATSGDVELLQQTLNNYSERMNELVTENIQVKQALKNLESELQAILSEHEEECAKQSNGDDSDQSQSALQLMSPRTRSLLSDFHPSQIDLPWELAGTGENIQRVLRSKLEMLRQTLAIKREQASTLRKQQHREEVVEALKSKIETFQQLLAAQDVLLQQALYTSEQETLLEHETKENRRLSMRAEFDDLTRRRKAMMGGNLMEKAPSSSSSRTGSGAAAVPPSPATLRILGGHTASNLPVFATPMPIKRRPATTFMPQPSPATAAIVEAIDHESDPESDGKQSADIKNGKENENENDGHGIVSSTSTSASTPHHGSSKSKWLAGGVVLTPTFTPNQHHRQHHKHKMTGMDQLSPIDALSASGSSTDHEDDGDNDARQEMDGAREQQITNPIPAAGISIA